MQSISIKLDIQCEICENSEYLQHDSGFYVCCICGTMSGVRHGVYLDYEEKTHGKYKIKRKGVDEEDNEDVADYQNYDSTMNTVVNTCANSEFGDSTATMRSRNKNDKQSKKSLNEILSDHQTIFIRLLKSIFSIQVQKCVRIISKKISDESNINQFDFSKLFEEFLEKSKSMWREFILLEYKNQIEKKPTFKQSNTKIRSRRNTDDNPNERKQSFNMKNKKNSIKEELKTRKIKQNNVVNLDDYQYNKLKSKDKLKKFIEEYDQVVASLKIEENLFSKEGIELSGNISFKNLLKIAAILKIPVEDNSTFEQVIHQIFVHRNLNLLSLYKEATFDESKSNLTSDNFLTLIYSIFNIHDHSKKKENNLGFNENLTFPVLLYRDISEIFKNFSLNNLFNSELKFLKYLNRERLLKLLDSCNKKIPNFRIEKLFVHICEDILHLPKFFSKFCVQIYSQSENQINRLKTHIYSLENFSLGVIVYSLKLFYGLNDLPYLLTIYQNKENNFYNHELPKENVDEIKTSIQLFDSIGRKDHLFDTFYQMPSLMKIVDNLKHLLKHDEDSHNLWEPYDLKKPLSYEYKEKFVNYNINYFSNVENNFTINHINSLEKEINKLKADKSLNLEEGKNMKINFSKKFLSKRKIPLREEKEFRKFLIEEIEFYNSLAKKKKVKNCEVPLPCDTYLRFNKKAMKFDGIIPPLSELVIMYYFSKYFKVEYKVLKKCCKIIEGSIENQFK